MNDLTSDNLALRVNRLPDCLRIDWVGRSDARRPAQVLTPWLSDLAQTAYDSGLTIEHRLAELEHMNSSSLVVLMRFITEARDRNLRVRVVYDGDSTWQRLSFAVLHRMAQAGLPVEVVAD